ncbi:low-temperature-induced cysteine proteinase [Humulus lupulus]|uniref:low-temperature-induced cysteine proteinase n=1 Tax=Humulus lupulus TaxID=3486 RepID=UPI002B41607D|nr:low-temperature-induced cysteine proteinase [Humulus lupulus]
MKILCFFLLSLLIHSRLSLSSSSSSSSPSLSTSQLFESWCEKHGKSYSSEEERLYRLRVFEDNMAFVSKHNQMPNSSYTLSLNAFADLTHHEFKASRLGFSPFLSSQPRPSSTSETETLQVRDIPASLDWRKKGAVTNVKDQASCGACWSFSATGAIEGINKIVTGSLVSLSEQELVDCDRSFNNGCNGGLMDYAFQFVIDNHGIDTEEDYPYERRETTCNKAKLKRHVVTIDGYTDVAPSNEKQLLQAVAAQPVSVGICGSERAFQLYSKGIFKGPCSTSLDHAVLIVGYDSQNGVDYWIVKNSWGRQWGMDGYIHIERNNGNSQGICGINMLASYPTKTSPNPPPSPAPGPTKCDLFSRCGEGETCCCAHRFIGICLSWKCCGLNSAVCCEDHLHCCPHDYPVCDIQRNQCIKSNTASNSTEALEHRSNFAKPARWGSLVEGWIL